MKYRSLHEKKTCECASTQRLRYMSQASIEQVHFGSEHVPPTLKVIVTISKIVLFGYFTAEAKPHSRSHVVGITRSIRVFIIPIRCSIIRRQGAVWVVICRKGIAVYSSSFVRIFSTIPNIVHRAHAIANYSFVLANNTWRSVNPSGP